MAEVPAGFQLFADDSLQKDLRLRRISLRQRELSLYDKFRGSISAFPKSSSKFSSDHQQEDGTTQLEQQQIEEIPTHGFVPAKLLDGLTVVQTESAIRALAQFHALSLKPMKQLKEEAVMPFTQISPQIEEAVKECLLEQLLDLPDSDEYFRQNEQALRTFWGKARFAAGVDVLGGKRAAEPVVLCHGNLSAENIWFPQLSAAEDEEKVEQLGKNDVVQEKTPLIVSWELARPGSGLSDLAHLLLSSINSHDLLQHLDSWLDLYLTTFEQHRQQLKKKEKKGTTTKTMVAAVTLPRRKFGFSSGKSLAEQQRKKRKSLNAHLQTQLARVLPKLAFEYRKLLADHLVEDPEAFERHRCDLLSRMTGGFELVRKELEEQLFLIGHRP